MHLTVARLCLDCEEVHTLRTCPVCGSDAFSFLTRWVHASEEAPAARPGPEPSDTPQVEAYRRLMVADAVRPKAGRLLQKGAVGLAAISLARWAWRRQKRKISEAAAAARVDQDEASEKE